MRLCLSCIGAYLERYMGDGAGKPIEGFICLSNERVEAHAMQRECGALVSLVFLVIHESALALSE